MSEWCGGGVLVPPLTLRLGDTLQDSIGLGEIIPPATVATPVDLSNAVVTYAILAPNGTEVFSANSADGSGYVTISQPNAVNTPILVTVPAAITATWQLTGPLRVTCQRAFRFEIAGVVKTRAVRDIEIYTKAF